MRDGCQSTAQCFLLDCLDFIADSQLFRTAVTGAYKGRSETLTIGVSSEIALDRMREYIKRKGRFDKDFLAHTKLSLPILQLVFSFMKAYTGRSSSHKDR